MRAALTGARGRLAPVLAEALESARWQVSRFSRTPGNGCLALEDFPAGPCPDVLVHCAWSTVPLTAENDPESWQADAALLERLARAAPSALVVFLSTGAVYGNTGPEPAAETRPPHPLGAYARGKLATERQLLKIAPERSLILRAGNLLIERSAADRGQGILPRLIMAAREGRPVEIWGDGGAVKDYLHVSDFCAALLRLLQEQIRGIFNVGSGQSHSVLEMIGCVERATGRKIERIHRPAFPWDVQECRLDCRRLQKAIPWSPRLSLEEAVRRCVAAC